MAPNHSLIHSVSEAGIAGEHSSLVRLPVLVAPATDDQFNTLRPALHPVACWSIGDARFRFGSSFVRPEVAEDAMSLAALVRGLRAKHGKTPLASVFGHADPVGDDSFNKKLSGRRAAAVYALLTRRTDIWEDIYSQQGAFTSALHADAWGQESIATMLADLGYFDREGSDGPVKEFQRDQELVDDGQMGPKTREKLFGAYMDKHCRNRKGEPFQLETKGFLGRGSDKAGKGDYQGCGEFNPLLLFSEDERLEFAKLDRKADRDVANAPNRRVIVLLFSPEIEMTLDRWPCPRAKEGTGACKKRLWSDADGRRANGEQRRLFEESGDTFGCRFYERLAYGSPCERVIEGLTSGLIYMRLCDATGIRPLADRKYRIVAHGGGLTYEGTTTSEGTLRHESVPKGDYDLQLDGVDRVIAALVLSPEETTPQVRYLEAK